MPKSAKHIPISTVTSIRKLVRRKGWLAQIDQGYAVWLSELKRICKEINEKDPFVRELFDLELPEAASSAMTPVRVAFEQFKSEAIVAQCRGLSDMEIGMVEHHLFLIRRLAEKGAAGLGQQGSSIAITPASKPSEIAKQLATLARTIGEGAPKCDPANRTCSAPVEKKQRIQ